MAADQVEVRLQRTLLVPALAVACLVGCDCHGNTGVEALDRPSAIPQDVSEAVNRYRAAGEAVLGGAGVGQNALRRVAASSLTTAPRTVRGRGAEASLASVTPVADCPGDACVDAALTVSREDQTWSTTRRLTLARRDGRLEVTAAG